MADCSKESLGKMEKFPENEFINGTSKFEVLEMKKLMNRPEDVVKEALMGLEAAQSDLVHVSYEPFFVARADAPIKGKVAIISGGGSGHEPLHSGFVGLGMLT